MQNVIAAVPELGSSLLGRALAYNRVTRALERTIAQANADVLIPHDLPVLRAAVHLKRTQGVPVLFDCHENWPVLVAENSRIEAVLTDWQERSLGRYVDHLLIPCEPVARKFRARGIPTTVILNSRPAMEVRRADRSESRRQLGYIESDFVLGYAGALAPGRGLELLLDAVSTLDPSVKLLIIGGPEQYRDNLRRRATDLGIQDRARLVGYQPFGALSHFYASMDMGAILLDRRPNHLTALPNKLFDYLAHGVPVLVPDYPAMASVVQESGAGTTLQDVDATAIREAIIELRDRRSDLRAMGERGRQAFLERFSWDKQEQVFLGVLKGIFNAAR